MEAGYKVHLANPCAIQQYSGLKFSDDKSDAFWLAEMLRLKILPEGYIYPQKDRGIRDLLRKRMFLVRHRTAIILSMKGMINNASGSQVTRAEIKEINHEEIERLFSDSHHKISGHCFYEVIAALNEQINIIERTVLE